MKFENRFTVKATQSEIATFHASARGLKAITPTPMTLHQAPEPIGEGDEVIFTLWVPFPLRWHSQIIHVSNQGFDDVQIAGLFASWQHRHNFIRIDDSTSEVYDQVTATLPKNPIKWVLALGMWISLPLLFRYRAYQTRKALES